MRGMDYKELVVTSYEIAVSKGWWEKPRKVSALLLLMQSEIAEALEEFRAKRGLSDIWYERSMVVAGGIKHTEMVLHAPEPTDKPCGIPVELADAVIRAADFAGHYKLDLFAVPYDGPTDFEDALAEANLHYSRAYEYHRNNQVVDQNVGSILDQATAAIVGTCAANGIDLEGAIAIKHEFNKTRSHRHGGKLI